MDPVGEWRVHIGVHKTATTHMQHLMEANRARIAAAGVDVIPTLASRPVTTPLVLRGGRLGWLRRLAFPRVLPARLRPLRMGPGTVVLSDENLIGYPTRGLAVEPFAGAGEQIRRIAGLGSARRPVALFVSVRSFATFYPSVYAEALCWDHQIMPRMAELRQALADGARPSWRPLIDMLLAERPRIALTLWPYEDYRAHAFEIVEAVIGRAVPGLEDVPPPTATMTPSAEVIAEVERLDPALGYEGWRDAVAAIRARHVQGSGSRYEAFDGSERARLDAIYSEELAALRAEHPEIFLDLGR